MHHHLKIWIKLINRSERFVEHCCLRNFKFLRQVQLRYWQFCFNQFLTFSNIVKLDLSTNALTRVNIFRLSCNWYYVIQVHLGEFGIKITNMTWKSNLLKYLPCLVHLQRHSKVFCYFMDYGDYVFWQCYYVLHLMKFICFIEVHCMRLL